jgi:phosphoglycolate phosphatase
MIGDRLHDIVGAHKCGMLAAGVLWGYGSKEEFAEAKADAVFETIEQMVRFF